MSRPIRTTAEAFEARMHARFKLIERARRDLDAAVTATFVNTDPEEFPVLQREIARIGRRIQYHIDQANAAIQERDNRAKTIH